MLEVEENKGGRVAGNIVVKAVTCTHLLHTYIKITALGQEKESERVQSIILYCMTLLMRRNSFYENPTLLSSLSYAYTVPVNYITMYCRYIDMPT